MAAWYGVQDDQLLYDYEAVRDQMRANLGRYEQQLGALRRLSFRDAFGREVNLAAQPAEERGEPLRAPEGE